MGTKAPGRTLGEEQAFQDGKVAGRRDALLALGGAFQKVLTPDSVDDLARALLDGLAKNPPLTTVESSGPVDPTDPTEPANWRKAPADVYAVRGCIFHYCPHAEQCKALESGCATLKPASGGVP